ncbi:MAG: hypothetical protein P1V35_14845 [Planctomycetota bacterium]|nr:hypothetical protein [Planctomycetota bacterium]
MNESQSTAATHAGGTRGITLAWILLMAFSLLNYFLAESWVTGKQLVIVVLSASLFKLVLVTGAFMELWSHGRPYFYIGSGLFVLTTGLIAGAW